MGAATVHLVRSGRSFAVTGRETILEAALKAGLEMDFSCQQGTCRTCIARVVAGEVEMEDDPDLAIGAKEMARGFRLLCVSVPRSAHVEIDL